MGARVLTPSPALAVARTAFSRVGDDGALWCESVPLARIVADVGTPVYVYTAAGIRGQYTALDAALAGVPHRIHYSAKANGNLALLRLLHGLGAGVDVVSGGELHRALRAGFAPGEIVFGGVGKTARELNEALDAGVLSINVESGAELDLLEALAERRGVVASVGIRVNPEVAVHTPHPYTRTGERGMRFGVPGDEALGVARRAARSRHLRLVGLDTHIGSQVAGVDPYEQAASRLVELYEALRATGDTDQMRFLDIGGGLAVSYGRGGGAPHEGDDGADVQAFARAVAGAVAATGLTLVVEPGRFLVASAGLLLARVLYRKQSGGKTHIITDAGMTELLRPSHYQAYHRIEPLVLAPTGVVRTEAVDVTGPVCESGDFLALDRALPPLAPGDALAIYSAGAYGFVMASNYNARPRPPEVLVDGARYAVVRAREGYDDLIRHEAETEVWRGEEG